MSGLPNKWPGAEAQRLWRAGERFSARESLIPWGIFFAVLWPGIVWAQLFAYGSIPGQTAQVSRQSADGPAAQQARRIYDRLIQARGDRRSAPPSFIFTRDALHGAWMLPDEGLIGLEEQAWEVCLTFGDEADDALAALLAHEVVHYYEKHGLSERFLPEGISSQNQRLLQETEADYLGGFLAYSASFRAFEQLPELLDRLYDKYPFPKEGNEKYPSLEKRKELARRSQAKMRELTEVFDLANLLLAIEDYGAARRCYAYILRYYQSRELYNNLGLTALLQARGLYDSGEFPYYLPAELDLEWQNRRSHDQQDRLKMRKELLREALLHFDAAISLDPGYAPAYLNKACAYILLDDRPRARFYAGVEAAERAQGNPKLQADVQILLGIAEALEGKNQEAVALLDQAAAGNPSPAARNRAVLQGSLPTSVSQPKNPFEKLDGLTLPVFSEVMRYYDRELIIDPELKVFAYTKPGGHSRILFYDYDDRAREVYFQFCDEGCEAPSKLGVKKGDTLAKVEAQYGNTQRRLESPRGKIMVYPRVIFLLDEEEKVRAWISFLTVSL